MIFVTQYGLTSLFQLLSNLRLVAVIETVAFVAKPDTDCYRKTKLMGFIQQRANIVAALSPAGPSNQVRFSAPQ
jgi:hypothetical protein